MPDGLTTAMQISPEPIGIVEVWRPGFGGSRGAVPSFGRIPSATHSPGKAGTERCRGPDARSTGRGQPEDATATGDAGSLPPTSSLLSGRTRGRWGSRVQSRLDCLDFPGGVGVAAGLNPYRQNPARKSAGTAPRFLMGSIPGSFDQSSERVRTEDRITYCL